MSDETPDTTRNPDGTITINRSGRYSISTATPRAILTYQAACEVFERNQVGNAAALVTLEDLRRLAIKAQRIIVDDLEQQIAEPEPGAPHLKLPPPWEIVRRQQLREQCPRCGGQGYVPDFQHWNQDLDEPRPKPCPKCAGGNE